MDFALLKMLFSRYTLVLVAVLVFGWIAYDWAEGRGEDKAKAEYLPKITKLEGTVKDLTVDRDKYKGLYEAQLKTAESQATAHALALKGLEEAQRTQLAEQKKKLDKLQADNAELKRKQRNAVTIYVPAAVDAAYRVPAGFVRFHDLSASGRFDSTGTAQGASLPASGPTDAGAPSGVAFSSVAETIGDNYAECRDREVVLRMWQDWYHGSLQSWTKAVADQANFKITLPDAPTVH